MIKPIKNIILVLIILLSNNFYGQSKVEYNNNLIAYTIRNEKIEFKNDKNRIFILISNLSCTACINEAAYKLNKLKSKLKDSCEYIIITLGDSKNVLYNRNTISYYSNIFKNIDKFLFNFNENNSTVFEFKGHLNSDFPKLFVLPKNSKFIFIETYESFNIKTITQILMQKNNLF